MIKTLQKTWAEIRPDAKTVREFGFILAGFFSIFVPVVANTIGYFFFDEPLRYPAKWAILGIGALLINFLLPPLMALVYRIAMFFARGISWVMTRLILGVLFYLILTPAALVMRLMGKDPLNRRFRDGQDSYWRRRERIREKQEYDYQF